MSEIHAAGGGAHLCRIGTFRVAEVAQALSDEFIESYGLRKTSSEARNDRSEVRNDCSEVRNDCSEVRDDCSEVRDDWSEVRDDGDKSETTALKTAKESIATATAGERVATTTGFGVDAADGRAKLVGEATVLYRSEAIDDDALAYARATGRDPT